MINAVSTAAPRRLVVIGASGLVGSHLVNEAARQGLPVVGVPRGVLLEDVLHSDDIVVNCALSAAYRTGPYDRAADLERQSAETAARFGAQVLMLSTRKVYRPACQWGPQEDHDVELDGVGYGPNKAKTEAWINGALGERALIVRLSNVFGFEYARNASARPSFFGQMLHRLRHEGEIHFDMAPETRRDFIPAGAAARSLVQAVTRGTSGVFNLGGGTAIACGDVARAVIRGYGQGSLRAANDIRDEFFLNNSKWMARFGCVSSPEGILAAARAFGEHLRYA